MIRMLSVLLSVLFLASCAVEQPEKETGKFYFQDQDDTTDALAIPLDNSEEEEEAEMRTLRQIQKREQLKKEFHAK